MSACSPIRQKSSRKLGFPCLRQSHLIEASRECTADICVNLSDILKSRNLRRVYTPTVSGKSSLA